MFAMNSNTKVRDLLDGSSNVIMIGERATQVPTPNGSETCGGAHVFGMRSAPNFNAYVRFRYQSAFGSGVIPINDTTPACISGYSSLHAGGAQFLFGDGRVAFISDNIDHRFDSPRQHQASAFENLLNIADGELLGDY